MKIFDLKNNTFVLETENTHYVIGVDRNGHNRQVHWGKKCNIDDYCIFGCDWGDENSNHTSIFLIVFVNL